jgi:glycine cleavage system H lipoate-binding protein/ABC-type phosphate transport system substrate-binding protein
MKTYLTIILNLKIMKKILILFLLMGIFLSFSDRVISEEVSDNVSGNKDIAVSVLCSLDLYNLAQQWINHYSGLNPESQLNLTVINPGELSETLESKLNLGIISDKYLNSIESKQLWITLIGREVIVPIINSNNPFIDKINLQGISAKDLVDVFNASKTKNWESLFESNENVPLNYYYIKDGSINSKVAEFIGLKKMPVIGIETNEAQELVRFVQNDPRAIGFCKLTDVINSDNQNLAENIKLLPIDKNGNGKLDYFEKIYDNINDFSRGVWIGKYPKTLITEIYSVSNGVPTKETERAFIKYALTEGQQFLNPNGFIELTYSERKSQMEKIINPEAIAEPTNDQYASYKLLLYAFIALIALFAGAVFLNAFIQKRKDKFKISKKGISDHLKVINENSLIIPNGLYYDKTHTWAFMEKDGIVKVGIDDFIQHMTGKITRIKMKNPGDQVKKNELLLSLIQDGKHLNIYAPFTGKIIDINESLVTNPSRINSSPYAEGWIYLIEPSNWLREIQFLRMALRYKEWLKDEFLRLKDFLSATINTKTAEFNFVTFQEGGELVDNVLKDFGPEVWEDFQKHFVDTSELS